MSTSRKAKPPKPGTIAADLANLGLKRRRMMILQKRLSQAKKEVGRLEFETYNRMLDEGFEPGESSVKIDGVLYEPHSQPFAQVTNKKLLLEYLEGNTSILIAKNPSKAELNQLVREKLDNGEELPPGLSWYEKTRIGARGLMADETNDEEEPDDEG